jgi:tetratricopeptide (TPR) repeat protein
MEKDTSRPAPGRIEAVPDRLDSWKDIAAYLKRDVTTAQRWERREAMPVHRHQHDKLGSVYAFRSELDAWRRTRRPYGHSDAGSPTGAGVPGSNTEGSLRRWSSPALALLSVLVALYLVQGPWIPEIEQSRAPALSLPAVQDSSASGNPDALAARHEYQVGRYYMWRFDEENLKLAIDHFERAIQLDPENAAAFAALSNAWWARGMFGPIGLRAAEAPARRAARMALMLDDRLAAAYVAQADIERLYGKDPPAAERLLTQALSLDPDSVEAHHSFALLLMALGRFPEALAHIERAAALDAVAPAIQSNFGRILYRAGRSGDAVSRFERALELEPKMRSVFPRLGDAYEQLGEYDRALEAYGRSGYRGPGYQANVARIFARMGRTDEARQLLESLSREQAAALPHSLAAAAYSALGDTNEASRLLARSIDRDDPGLSYFPVDPKFVSLHSLPEWPELLRRTGFSPTRRQ